MPFGCSNGLLSYAWDSPCCMLRGEAEVPLQRRGLGPVARPILWVRFPRSILGIGRSAGVRIPGRLSSTLEEVSASFNENSTVHEAVEFSNIRAQHDEVHERASSPPCGHDA